MCKKLHTAISKLVEKKKLDNRLGACHGPAMDKEIRHIRRHKNQISVTIPRAYAVKSGLHKCKYVTFEQQKDGTIKIRRFEIGKTSNK